MQRLDTTARFAGGPNQEDYSGTDLTRRNSGEGQPLAQNSRNIFTFDIDETDSDEVSESVAASKVHHGLSSRSRVEAADQFELGQPRAGVETRSRKSSTSKAD